MRFIVRKGTEEFGPFDLPELQKFVDEGFFRLTDFCLGEEWRDWKRLSSLVARMPGVGKKVGGAENTSPAAPQTKNGTNGFHPIPFNPPRAPAHCKPSVPCTATSLPSPATTIDLGRLTSMAAVGFVDHDDAFRGTESSIPEPMFHIARGAEQIGVFTAGDIDALVSSGQLLATDWWFHETLGEWIPLSSFTWLPTPAE